MITITKDTYKLTISRILQAIACTVLRSPTTPSDFREHLENLRGFIDAALNGVDDEPPEMPERKTVYEVQYSHDGRDWMHVQARFGSESAARSWALDDHDHASLWQRICAIETSYTLVKRNHR